MSKRIPIMIWMGSWTPTEKQAVQGLLHDYHGDDTVLVLASCYTNGAVTLQPVAKSGSPIQVPPSEGNEDAISLSGLDAALKKLAEG